MPVAMLEEERPVDFHARLPRKPRAIGKRRKPAKHRGRRLAVLAVAIAVPAMAAPEEWQPFDALSDSSAYTVADPMPFEQKGQSFPGSAFYYLEDAPQLAYEQASLFDSFGWPSFGGSDEPSSALTQVHDAGPVARGFSLAGSYTDRARARRCLAMAVHYEAASESRDGQRAVAQVVLNRVAHPSYPDSVCGVVFQGSERVTGCQFSFTCDGSLKRKPAAASWTRAEAVADEALSGHVFRPVGLATHYHATYVLPYWASSLDNVGTIGLHTFYRWRGAAGKSAAFTSAYNGGEPAAAPRPRSVITESAAATDPVALARAYEQARQQAATAARTPAPAPVQVPAPRYREAIEARGGDALFTAGKLPGSGAVKEEYANSGRWIAEPK